MMLWVPSTAPGAGGPQGGDAQGGKGEGPHADEMKSTVICQIV